MSQSRDFRDASPLPEGRAQMRAATAVPANASSAPAHTSVMVLNTLMPI